MDDDKLFIGSLNLEDGVLIYGENYKYRERGVPELI